MGKKAPPLSFAENDDEAKSVLNWHYHCLLPISIHNLFILETFQVYLTMSLLYETALKMLLKINTIFTDMETKDNISLTEHKLQYNTRVALQE